MLTLPFLDAGHHVSTTQQEMHLLGCLATVSDWQIELLKCKLTQIQKSTLPLPQNLMSLGLAATN